MNFIFFKNSHSNQCGALKIRYCIDVTHAMTHVHLTISPTDHGLLIFWLNLTICLGQVSLCPHQQT